MSHVSEQELADMRKFMKNQSSSSSGASSTQEESKLALFFKNPVMIINILIILAGVILNFTAQPKTPGLSKNDITMSVAGLTLVMLGMINFLVRYKRYNVKVPQFAPLILTSSMIVIGLVLITTVAHKHESMAKVFFIDNIVYGVLAMAMFLWAIIQKSPMGFLMANIIMLVASISIFSVLYNNKLVQK